MSHNYDELKKQYDAANSRVVAAKAAKREAMERLCEAAPDHEGFPVGSLVKVKRYGGTRAHETWRIVGGQDYGYGGKVCPDAVIVKKDGTDGVRRLSSYFSWSELSLVEPTS